MHVTGTVLLTLALTVPVRSQEPEHLGPEPTRDQFPINLETLTYVPAPPDVLPAGAFEANVQCVEANTFEFSDLIKDALHQGNSSQRLSISLPQAQQFAAQNPNVPLIFFFQMETTLTTLRLRAGLGDGREAWVMLPVLRWSGGFEDGANRAARHNTGAWRSRLKENPAGAEIHCYLVGQGAAHHRHLHKCLLGRFHALADGVWNRQSLTQAHTHVAVLVANDEVARAFIQHSAFFQYSDRFMRHAQLLIWLPMTLIVWQLLSLRRTPRQPGFTRSN